MRFYNIPAIFASMLCFAACSDSNEPARGGDDDRDRVYSFTAIIDTGKSRLGYQEDSDSHNLKMVWDEGDVIRLYPDESMGDSDDKYYDFVANTGAGTSHTVFVHQGYITNWEHWKGKAIYVFPDGDNLNVEDDSEEFLAKAYVQKANNNTEHLKYAEFKPTADGKKSYTGYWTAFLDDANLKMDHQMTFGHENTVVYKIMLRGFLFNIPGGSQLQMIGDAWPGEVTTLTLGSKDDKDPFLEVGAFGKAEYKKDEVLTAYIIRQTPVTQDGNIKAGGKVKFRLLCYDELDGTVMQIDGDDKNQNRQENKDTYFTNLPWGDEYTWEVELTEDKVFNAGDYVVADFTDTSKPYSNPLVAIDLGLRVKWAAFNVGADRPDRYGKMFIYGVTKMFDIDLSFPSSNENRYSSGWKTGDPDHDAAAKIWGDGWRMPDFDEMCDLMQYTRVVGGTEAGDRWTFPYITENAGQQIWKITTDCTQKINGTVVIEFKSKVNERSIYMPLAGAVGEGVSNKRKEQWGTYLTSDMKGTSALTMRIMAEEGETVKIFAHHYMGSAQNRAFSIRAVK